MSVGVMNRMLNSKAHIPLQTGFTLGNQMSANNIKCTWPMQKFCIGDPSQSIFHWLALGFCVGGNANFMFCVGGYANFSILRYQHVSIPNAKFRAGGLSHREDPTQVFLRPVEYRLKD